LIFLKLSRVNKLSKQEDIVVPNLAPAEIWCQKNLQLNSCQVFYSMRLARKKEHFLLKLDFSFINSVLYNAPRLTINLPTCLVYPDLASTR